MQILKPRHTRRSTRRGQRVERQQTYRYRRPRQSRVNWFDIFGAVAVAFAFMVVLMIAGGIE